MKYLAGGVVIGPGNKIAVVNQHGNAWSLPKGHLEQDEDEESAATREIFEETGIQDVHVIEKIGEYERGRIGPDGVGEIAEDVRHITIFLCITNQSELQPIDPDNPYAEWLEIRDVSERLTHTKDKAFFQSVIPHILRFISS